MKRVLLFATGVDERLPLALRERYLAFSERERSEILKEVGCSAFVLLETCQRLEVYGTAEESLRREDLLQRLFPLPDPYRASVFYLENADAVRRLFRIATGLESALRGEVHILGQLKRAWEKAHQNGHTGKLLNVLFQDALRVGKKVQRSLHRERTLRSFGSLVAEVLEEFLGSLEGKNICILGWGTLGRSIAGTLLSRKAGTIFVFSRHLHHIPQEKPFVAIAEKSALKEVFAQSHAVVCASGSARYSLAPEYLNEAIALPQVLIDLALPRAIDPVLTQGRKLLDLETFLGLARERTLPFVQESEHLEALITEEVERFLRKWRGFQADPVIRNIALCFEETFSEARGAIVQACNHDEQELLLLRRIEWVRRKLFRKTAEQVRRFFEEER
ncbi:hypothetical protein ACP6EK_09265 [Candidatus Caldatribacterium sp. SIUC1]|uniref:hypothetical protein n=1 Tax=Candidatus Caldatribacterium sp. SIUC1 TaxID=3418365 RepID=UPI003F68D1D6